MRSKSFNVGSGPRQVAWIVVRPLVGGPVLAASLIALGFAIHARLKVMLTVYPLNVTVYL